MSIGRLLRWHFFWPLSTFWAPKGPQKRIGARNWARNRAPPPQLKRRRGTYRRAHSGCFLEARKTRMCWLLHRQPGLEGKTGTFLVLVLHLSRGSLCVDLRWFTSIRTTTVVAVDCPRTAVHETYTLGRSIKFAVQVRGLPFALSVLCSVLRSRLSFTANHAPYSMIVCTTRVTSPAGKGGVLIFALHYARCRSNARMGTSLREK